ncbi:hypothetical protein R3X25_11720 [Lutibacter sp. TH_r2]|uniref:hypothetical protein n=1 Tax=Lutibacter sp. TH_r2 TaxID=3082083 RepID=UPI0029549D97|nr:hypothetical protein [Lutibacter sp. TH_r2]MDV7187951.1 hypothetical protein [Lutibacter sp. TH_r2]
MTAQAFEKLIYKNEEHKIACEPLYNYLVKTNKNPFAYKSTDCSRGYIGTWKIENKKLYLIDLIGFTDNEDVGIESLFNEKKIVFASWFSGEMKVPQGERIQYSHRGHFSVFEKDLIFEFINGELIGQKLINNMTKEVQEIDINQIEKDDLKNKINQANLFELIEMLNTPLKEMAGNDYLKYRAEKISETHTDYIKVDIKNWNYLEKEKLFIGVLRGINHFYFIITNKSKMPLSGFNSVMNAIGGENHIFVNKKSIKWFDFDVKSKLKNQGVIFEDLKTYTNDYVDYDYNDRYNDNNWLIDASGTDDPETMNDVYWNLD